MGKNGTGKTNLLDAIYMLCYTKSYFSNTYLAQIMNHKEGFRIEGLFLKNTQEDLVCCMVKNGKKEIYCNQQLYEKQTEHIGKYTAVMIAPDDLEIINGASELKRKFIDAILCQCDKKYFTSLLNYQKILLQRNAWLKNYAFDSKIDYTSVDFYNEQLKIAAQYIFEKRTDFLQQFSPLFHKYYNILSTNKESLQLSFKSDLNTDTAHFCYVENMDKDIRAQRSLKGIHRDDLDIVLNEHNIKQQGSQGQKKSCLFALKLAQYEYILTHLNHKPLLLLDDIFEKLDQERMDALMALLQHELFGQVLITDTHYNRMEQYTQLYKNIAVQKIHEN